uniref:Alternative protein CHRNA6 n=1 Tax=Homo sapiens TaxID=9606 RepID=L8ECB0_HUMAN|nr:alternative protein CHRNA6 [Homo sapiens]
MIINCAGIQWNMMALRLFAFLQIRFGSPTLFSITMLLVTSK